MIRLNLGAGGWLRAGFTNVDLYPEDAIRSRQGFFATAKIEDGAEYVQADIRKLPFEDEYADYVEMIDVIEHISWREVVSTLVEVRRVMKIGGKLMISTVNMDGMVLEWLRLMCSPVWESERYSDCVQGIFGSQIADGELHRSPFNPRILGAVLTEAGFENPLIHVIALGSPLIPFGTIDHESGKVARFDLLRAEAVK